MIVLFTDFGVAGPYVGQVTAVLRQRAPTIDVIELFSDAPAHNPQASAYLLAAYVNEFPAGTVFLCVVDPGVGGDRSAGFLQADDRWFVGPDNGLLAIVARRAENPGDWFEMTDLPEDASATFHGRDIFAPAAARLALGDIPAGAERSVHSIRRPDWPDDLAEAIYIDGFGNVMTGMRAAEVPVDVRMWCRGKELRRARTFSDVPAGEAFWYANSNGLAEIAVNGGRACDILELRVGIKVEFSEV